MPAADQMWLGERDEPRHEDGKAHPDRRQLDLFVEVCLFVVCVSLFLKLSASCRDFMRVSPCRYLEMSIDNSAVAMWSNVGYQGDPVLAVSHIFRT